MTDDHATRSADSEYEPPAVVDLGTVRAVTNGSAKGSGDENGQEIG